MKIIALCLVSALGAAHAAEPITLKGLAPGITKAQIEELHPGMTSRCSAISGDPTTDEVCVSIGSSRADLPALATFAGVRAKHYAVNLWKGVVHTVLVGVESSDFGAAEAAVSERYGKPSDRKVSTVTNRMGAEFDQVRATWRRGDSVLAARKRSSSVDDADFQLTTEKGIEERYKRRQEGAKTSAKDM